MASGVSTSMVLTLLGFCGSVLFIVFVCTRLRLACSLLRRHRRRRAALARFPAASTFLSSVYVDHRQGPPSSAGLDPAAVAAFPTRAFSSSSSNSSDSAAAQ
ncbi:hypothetical protein E2562_024371 [Oryza meyeriana var. granulata]|uniref:Uncharacterized protein n=1 Tax=Oryza meyeriana var. granulata TaxID=110450 RepID=A0A6G1CA73_9ORYZ|nr:hypothetical protein E2562_024371 [Oryza meyeriana var. granulata]